ncbi:MAG: hypothetical protein O2971_17840 [Proteobacteria bacterium]|nr:hypothetical protein [Pseudomonadota bacterium]
MSSHVKAALVLLAIWVGGWGWATAQTSKSLDLFNEDPLRPRGQNVIPLYDGWFPNPDGTFTLCFGYFNMNTEQSIDVPVGAGNRIEPAIYDGVQPTHFDPVPAPTLTRDYRHHWCVFSVTVPEDFGNADVIWSLETQGNTLSVPGSLIPSYVLDEQATSGRDAVAPYLSLNDDPPGFRGRRGLWEGPRVARVGEPVPLIARISHPEAGTWLNWTLHQGPAAMEFSQAEIRLDSAAGVAMTTATFSEPGSYVVRVQAINDTERRNEPTYGFEFYCCWTNGYVRVDVTE